MVSVEFESVVKRFGSTVAVDRVSLKINEGELFFLLGPSGCGKTTCLRMVAGFISPDGGCLTFDGHDIGNMPPHRRNVGMVFQTYALFPHMTVEQNVAYGLRFRKVGAADRKRRTAEILERTRLEGLGKRLPAQLSGGQQQRVALARALVIQPDVLLLDEPLSNLDTRLRIEVREEIKKIHEEFRITALYVTHDQDEALSLADRLAVMRDGRIEQMGTPEDIYARPANAFVAGFVGDTNILSAAPAVRDGTSGIDTPAGWVPIGDNAGYALPVGEFDISVRPESVKLADPSECDAAGTVRSIDFFGSTARIILELDNGLELSALAVGPSTRWKKGSRAGIRLEAGDVVILK